MPQIHIELRHLRYFAALAEEQHFGRAAERCNISQPPFSVAIRQLETELGFALVDRDSSPLRLTPAGEKFYEEVLRSISQIDYSIEAATLVSQGMDGVLRIGFFGSMLGRGLTSILRLYESEHPNVEIRLVELNTREQISALQRGTIDYGFLHTSMVPEGLGCELIVTEPLMLCVPAESELSRRSKVKLADAASSYFILFSRSVSPTYYDKLISVCTSAGFHPQIKHEVRHWYTAVACVANGLGVALVPASMRNAGVENVSYLSLESSSSLPQLWAAWPARKVSNAAVLAFHAAVTKHFQRQAQA
jgi:DNA-binding transcriptional LysR family regulator